MALFGCRELINVGGGFVAIARWMQEPCCKVGIWIWNTDEQVVDKSEFTNDVNITVLKDPNKLSVTKKLAYGPKLSNPVLTITKLY